LTLPDGSKEPLHNHNWHLIVAVSADKPDKMGLVMDFGRLSDIIDGIIAPFESTQLEQFDVFENINSSAENVAKYIFDRIEPLLPSSVRLEYVKITEAPRCSVTYTE